MLPAIAPSPYRNISLFNSADPRTVYTQYDLYRLWCIARDLRSNPEVAKLIEDMVGFAGVILPRPRTRDEEWNRAARRAFLRVTMSENWDVSGALDWYTAQEWAEEHAIVDGDCLTVLTRQADGTAAAAFYEAPQVSGHPENSKDFVSGVRCNAAGRPLEYCITTQTADGKRLQATIPAAAAVLYRHHPDPARPRGLTELLPSINPARDEDEINRLNKAGVKNAAMFALYETQNVATASPGESVFESLAAEQKKAAGQQPPANAAEQPALKPLTVNGAMVATLAPGNELKTVHDPRPANETRNFVHDIVRQIAAGAGMDPELVHYMSDLNSAATRMVAQKLQRWVKRRQRARERWANRIYRHVLSCEIAAGRLALPAGEPDPAAVYDVEWVNLPTMTIDVAREGKMWVDLTREGVYPRDQLSLMLCGKTAAEVAELNASSVAAAKLAAERNGITLAELMPGTVGTTVIPSDEPTPQALPDDEPEGA